MKQQTNNPQSTTAQALTSFPENSQLYIFAYTITDIMHILNKSASWYISFELSGLLAEYPISPLTKTQFFPLIVQCRTFRKHAFFFTDFIDLRV